MMNNNMDPFSSFFGDFNFAFGGEPQHPQETKGANVIMELYVTLEELYSGNFIEVKFYKYNTTSFWKKRKFILLLHMHVLDHKK